MYLYRLLSCYTRLWIIISAVGDPHPYCRYCLCFRWAAAVAVDLLHRRPAAVILSAPVTVQLKNTFLHSDFFNFKPSFAPVP